MGCDKLECIQNINSIDLYKKITKCRLSRDTYEQKACLGKEKPYQIARFMGPTWGPSGAHVGPMNLAIRVNVGYMVLISFAFPNILPTITFSQDRFYSTEKYSYLFDKDMFER